jgi:hypothetical protein
VKQRIPVQNVVAHGQNKMIKEILKWAGEFITCLLFMGTLAGITWFVLVVYG